MVEPLSWVQSAWDWVKGYKHDKDVPAEIKLRVDAIAEAKKNINARENIHGWRYSEEDSSDRVAIYVDDKKQEVHAIVRGTNVKNYSDLLQDAKVFVGMSPSTQEVQGVLENVSEKYASSYDLDVLGYSLGGSIITNIFTNDDPESKTLLDKYDDVVLLNPGGSPFNTEHVKEIMNQDRTTLLSNRSDVVSSMYTTNVQNNDQAYYGPASWGALQSHSWEQFSTGFDGWDTEPLITNEKAVLAAVGLD